MWYLVLSADLLVMKEVDLNDVRNMCLNVITNGKALIWFISEAYTVIDVGVHYTENVTKVTLQIFQLLLTIEALIVQCCRSLGCTNKPATANSNHQQPPSITNNY